MERLHRPINSFLQFLEECMEAKAFSSRSSAHEAVNGENQSTPFLEMLQGEMRRADEPPEPSFQLLLRLQEQGSRGKRAVPEVESCVTLASDAGRTAPPKPAVERKKRKRASTAAAKSSGAVRAEAENQRMTHIVVERNRRRLMNEHLAALRSLMPSSFVQRGDQASIIGGAIEFVKELEQMLLSLRAEKSSRAMAVMEEDAEEEFSAAASDFFISPQYLGYSRGQRRGEEEGEDGVDVEATVVQGHVNLKVAGRRRAGQLVRAVAAMEELRLTVLHLSITSLDAISILYSLNLKMEEDCNLGSADEIATAVHQIFSFINAC